MAAVDSFYFLYREIERSCSSYVEALAVVGAFYTASKAFSLVRDCYSLIRLHFIPRLISRADLVQHYGKWAVICGAVDGLGKAYAEELARRGVSIILICPDKRSMDDVARALTEAHRVEAAIIEADFSQGRAAYKPITEALKDKEIGFLVNNVAELYGYPQHFTEVPEDKLWDIINTNIAAATMMVHVVLPGMLERKKGAIINISSGSCCKPTPKMTASSASKAYVDHFSRALHYEYASKGIFVQSLVPFYIASQMNAVTGVIHSGWLVPHPQVYARHAVSTLGISHRTTGYWPHSIQFWFAQYMPEWMWVWGSNILSQAT
ncbi:inactive hydroxysteroid dehydrogenase-like protein 1 [Amia ocellicauda]|uniref:inactive hydroxysteroid dehydrogenase-like protein 1 n=1 Tax=Amia ocellicauda TaxID=2972642 RepID=UPI003464E690